MRQIELSQGEVALVDDADYEHLSGYKWFYRGERGGKQGYGTRHGGKDDPARTIYMHRQIMQPPPGHAVVFLNGDRLDCRRENLRIVTTEESRLHHRVRKDCETGHKGVRYNRKAHTYSVDIIVDGQMLRVGTFLSWEHAIQAREEAEKKYFPDRPMGPEVVDRAALADEPVGEAKA